MAHENVTILIKLVKRSTKDKKNNLFSNPKLLLKIKKKIDVDCSAKKKMWVPPTMERSLYAKVGIYHCHHNAPKTTGLITLTESLTI